MKITYYIIILLLLSSCADSSSSTEKVEPTIIDISNDEFDQIINDKSDVNITGSGNRVTFNQGTDISNVIITGNNNIVTFNEGCLAISVEISGSDNTIIISASIGMPVAANTGLGNIFYQI